MIPINRSARLDTLSNDHQDGLLFVWKVREGLANNTAIELLSDYCIWYWKNCIKPHFATEERVIFPFLLADDGLVCRVKEQRRDLSELFMEMTKGPDTLLIGMMAGLFEFHIRFEERIFFPYLEQRLPAAELEILASLLGKASCENESWPEKFWLSK
jgi:hypothetical protein